MLKTQSENIEDIIKVLTILEIDRYCEKRSDVGQVSSPSKLVVGGEAFTEPATSASSPQVTPESAHGEGAAEDKAKILPFNKEAIPEPTEAQSVITPETELEKAGILSADKIKELEQQKRKKQEAKKESTSVFLIRERLKMKDSQSKLVEQMAIKSYVKNSQVTKAKKSNSLPSDDDSTDEEAQKNNSHSSGILFNKKQY